MMNKKGNTMISTSIILVVSIIFIMVLSISFIGMIKPFIMYEKLNKISQKYMFVVEKFGYLTSNEKNLLIEELEEDGFKKENLIINAPGNLKSYGELINFEISYKMEYQTIKFYNGKLLLENKDIILKSKNYSYSKI